MNENFNDLKLLFLKIKKLGWVKTLRSGYGGIGYTFETLLGKPEENFYLPDYRGIEIKTKRLNSFNKNIRLFSAAPDGMYVFPIKELCERFGYPDKELHYFNVLNGTVYTNKISSIGVNYKFSLCVDYNNKCLRLKVYDKFCNLIEENFTWSFDLMYERLYAKLQNLAYIRAKNKFIGNVEYFYYYDIHFYKLKNFDVFIDLINKGIISVEFKIGVFKNGNKKGKIYDHGTGFVINEYDLLKLFDLIH